MVIPCYTHLMKTAISVPDAVYVDVEAAVRQLGISRSQFYVSAAQRYLGELSHDELVDQINEAVALETAASLKETAEFLTVGMASSQARLGNEQW